MIKRRALALFAGLLLLAMVPGSTLAVVATIDQSNVPAAPPPVTNTSGTLAESFTVGQTGLMTAVDLYLITAGGAVSTTVNVLALDGSGHPTGSALATGTVSVSTTGAFINFPFGTALSATAGQKYAIEVVLGDAGPWWYGATSETYGGGVAMFTQTFPTGWTAPAPPVNTPIIDYYFRTYVAPPVSNGTAPPTSTGLDGSSNNSSPLAALMICFAFGGLALVAVEARRLRMRNEAGPR